MSRYIRKTTPKTLEERFWGKVNIPKDVEGCWIWTGSKLRGGYGGININHKTKQAHRVSYELHYGEIPDGTLVCHKCDNPPCVNPHHLFLGNYKVNAEDKCNKGRMPTGERIPTNKLTQENVLEIRRMISFKIPRRKIAKIFGVGSTCITDIATGRTWSWLKNE